MAKLGLTAALKQCRGYSMPDNYFKGVDHDASYVHEQLSRLPVGMRQAKASLYSQHYSEEKRAKANNWLRELADKYEATKRGETSRSW